MEKNRVIVGHIFVITSFKMSIRKSRKNVSMKMVITKKNTCFIYIASGMCLSEPMKYQIKQCTEKCVFYLQDIQFFFKFMKGWSENLQFRHFKMSPPSRKNHYIKHKNKQTTKNFLVGARISCLSVHIHGWRKFVCCMDENLVKWHLIIWREFTIKELFCYF